MKKSVLVKVIGMTILSIIVSMFIHLDEVRQSALGKEEFLKRESARFDLYLSHPHISLTIIMIFIFLILFGLYELICHLILKLINNV